MMNTKHPMNRKFHSNIADLHFINLNSVNSRYLKNILAQRSKDNQERWLIIAKDQMNVEELIADFSNVNMDLDDDLYFAISNNHSQITLFELYRIVKTSPILHNEVGKWQENTLQWTIIHKWQRRRNLNGHKFKMTTMAESPFITSINQK